MREVIAIILIIVIIFAGNFVIEKYLENSSKNIYSNLEDLKNKTITAKENDDRTEAREQFENTNKEWKKTYKLWSVIVVHQELDYIDEALTKAKSCIYNGDLGNGLEEIETAMFFVNHVRDREKVSIKNIF